MISEVWDANEVIKIKGQKEEENPEDLTDDVIEDGFDS